MVTNEANEKTAVKIEIRYDGNEASAQDVEDAVKIAMETVARLNKEMPTAVIAVATPYYAVEVV